jgi:hypothetical protein
VTAASLDSGRVVHHDSRDLEDVLDLKTFGIIVIPIARTRLVRRREKVDWPERQQLTVCVVKPSRVFDPQFNETVEIDQGEVPML